MTVCSCILFGKDAAGHYTPDVVCNVAIQRYFTFPARCKFTQELVLIAKIQSDGRLRRCHSSAFGHHSRLTVPLVSNFRGQFIQFVEGDVSRPVTLDREWERSPFHFDDVGKAMLTLFTVSTFEGWPGYVLQRGWVQHRGGWERSRIVQGK